MAGDSKLIKRARPIEASGIHSRQHYWCQIVSDFLTGISPERLVEVNRVSESSAAHYAARDGRGSFPRPVTVDRPLIQDIPICTRSPFIRFMELGFAAGISPRERSRIYRYTLKIHV